MPSSTTFPCPSPRPAVLASPIEAATAQTGTFAWRWPGTPPDLISLWTEGAENVITKGAVMSFESQHGLTADGLAGRRCGRRCSPTWPPVG